jgi:hypothetical protein
MISSVFMLRSVPGVGARGHGLGDGAVVEPVQFAADRHAAGQHGDLDAGAGQAVGEIVGGGLAIDGGGEGKDHFADRLVAGPADQGVHAQGLRSDAVERG